MTYSHDKTILARLGFQDPDAKDPLHDLACEYMALEENVLKLREMTQASEIPTQVIGQEFERDNQDNTYRRISKFKITESNH